MNSFEGEHAPLVSIVTLNYNQAEVTAAFLESSKKLLYPNIEILVCDMGSAVNPASVFDPASYPHTRLLLCGKNLGFAAGNNWGIRQASGSYLFIVNNDTELTPDIIGTLLIPFYRTPAIGVVCPKIKYFEKKNIIQYAGFQKMNPFTGRTATIGDRELDEGQHDRSGVTFGAHGAAMMVKRDVIRDVGMFPEKFFLYYEEWDWSTRIRNAGYLIWYQADATIYHKESVTVGRNNPMKVYYHTRNRILYMRRNSDAIHLIVFFLFYSFLSLPRAVFNFLKNGQFQEIKFLISGAFYNLTHSSRSVI